MASRRICLIEDDEIMGGALALRLKLEGYPCDWFKSGRAALAALRNNQYGAVISDIVLRDGNGEKIYAALREENPNPPPFIFMTGQATVDQAVRLIKLGAVDYITKPFEPELLLAKLSTLAVRPETESGPEYLGISPAMRAVEDLLARLAASDASVLITGESGVGKEVVARRLHQLGQGESERPFVAINCGAMPETLMEAELFGYEKGAYTGANKAKRGLFEQADGGTLFLDEIGDMPAAMQIKLLRAVQDRQIRHIGGEADIPVNFRLLAATHQDLAAMIERGLFREDLYYRIHVIQVRVPPLRERREDILWLARRFLAEAAGPDERPHLLSPATERLLMSHPWPGNVRELLHVMKRARILTRTPMITPDSLFEAPNADAPAPPDLALNDWLAHQERDYILRALEARNWRVQETAKLLGIGRKNLWEKMKRLEIRRDGDEADMADEAEG